ncbi:substrate-binding periplasmic protein [Canibacter zhoujuaniae]|uniref:substrate-binding periplasmic protein n=1 Tax=Canibacter zhoujuaniae TaxID=2708343 RepID=UPI001423044F|nr:transporter substrate-binding domain-containing protein [Canibacter zhoujuaniae]
MTEKLRLACIDSPAMPLFGLADANGVRDGYEPEVAKLLAEATGRVVEWVMMPWDDMLPSVQQHRVDAVLCGQGIIPSREEQVDFVRPYAVFNESVLVRAGDPARSPEDLNGYKVAAIANSANMRLAETFPGAILVPFGASDDVFSDMIEAVRSGEVDAMVDDDVVTVPLGEEADFDLAFTAETRNPWGVGVAKDCPEMFRLLNDAMTTIIENGKLKAAWNKWFPHLPYPEESLEGATK